MSAIVEQPLPTTIWEAANDPRERREPNKVGRGWWAKTHYSAGYWHYLVRYSIIPALTGSFPKQNYRESMDSLELKKMLPFLSIVANLFHHSKIDRGPPPTHQVVS